jgi:CheY-like chemotaxis protein
MEEDERSFLKAGMDPFLTKPIHPEKLVSHGNPLETARGFMIGCRP